MSKGIKSVHERIENDLKFTGCPEFCPSDYTPVCGNDGRTYSNRCELAKARCNRSNQNQQLSVSYNGECDSGRSSKYI